MKTTSLPLQISKEYRSIRSIASLLCAISFAWAAAEIDLKAINFALLGSIDITHNSISLLLFLGVLYLFLQCTLEFVMQPIEVRRWRPAQLDFIFLLNLVRVTILMLAATVLGRALTNVAYVAAFAGGMFLTFLLLLLITFMILVPTFTRKGKSLAGGVCQALEWSLLIATILLVAALIILGMLSIRSETMRLLWPTAPSVSSVAFIVIAASFVLLSFFVSGAFYRRLFAVPSAFRETVLPDGRRQRTYTEIPPPVWDWSIDQVGSATDHLDQKSST